MSAGKVRRFRAAAVAALVAMAGQLPVARAADAKTEVRQGLSEVQAKMDAWDIPGAEEALARVAKRAPNVEPVEYFQGRLAFEEGRYDDAVKLLTAAGIEDKQDSYLGLAKDTRDIIRDHKTAESAHFIFYYPPGKDEVLVPYALDALEKQRAALEHDLGFAPPGKVRVEVVNDAHELSKVSTLTYKEIETTGTIAICKFSKLMVTSPKAVLRGYDWLDTLAHEFTHLVVTEASKNGTPIWLHEGMAKYLETRWRGAPGQAMTPSTLALLGLYVKKNKLIPFEKMHPSIAKLPSDTDAAVAFAEVFMAIDLLYKDHGTAALRTIVHTLADSAKNDQGAVEAATGKSFAAFQKAWLAHIKEQHFPDELLPRDDRVVLKDQEPAAAKKKEQPKGREISYGEFAIIDEPEAKRFAHLGELMRERRRPGAAVEEFGKAHRIVGDKYPSVSDKYALALLEVRQTNEAETVLQGSLKVHPGLASTSVHLGRIYLVRKEYAKAESAYLQALATDPFDPEIHLGLLRTALEQNKGKEADRERHATELLTNLKPNEAETLARSMFKEQDLADVQVPAPAPAATPAAKSPDAGTAPRPQQPVR